MPAILADREILWWPWLEMLLATKQRLGCHWTLMRVLASLGYRVAQSKCQITVRSWNLFEPEEGTLVEMRWLRESKAWLGRQNKTIASPLPLFSSRDLGCGNRRAGKGKERPAWRICGLFFPLVNQSSIASREDTQQDIESRYNLPRFIKLGRACLLSSQAPQKPNSHSYWNWLLEATCYLISQCSKSLWGDLTGWSSYLQG